MRTLTVSSAGGANPNFGKNLIGTMKKYLPLGIKEFVHCGFEVAKLPLKEAKNLASQFSGMDISTPIGDTLVNWTQTASEKGAEKATEWTISATDLIAQKVAGR